MRKNVIALACTAVLAVALALPFGLAGKAGPRSDFDNSASNCLDPDKGEGQRGSYWDEAPKASLAETGDEVVIEAEHVPGVVLIDLNDGVPANQVNERLQSLPYVTTDFVSESDALYGYVELELAEGVSVEEAMRRLSAEEFVAAAQPNFVYHLLDDAEGTSGDQAPEMEAAEAGKTAADGSALVAQRIDLTAQATGTDRELNNQWGLKAINAINAWYIPAQGNHKVTVAVLDSGLDMDHPDFADGNGKTNVVDGYSVLQANKKARGDRSADPTNYDDPIGHGTHVAGIVSAGTYNSIGVAGVSYNANIMPVQVIDKDKNVTSADAAAGIQYVMGKATSDNVRVINISFGSDKAKVPTDAEDRLLMQALESAHNRDILVVFAAGNGGNGKPSGAYNCFPCDSDPEGIGVIAVRQKNGSTGYEPTSTTNCNKAGQRTKVLSAPGYDILSTWNDGDYLGNSGTSMAAPFVSGTAALMFAVKPTLSAQRAKDYLCASAKDINGTGFDNETGYGLVNAYDAVRWAKDGRVVKTIESCTIASISNQSYTGRAVKPALSVRYGGTLLREGRDYSVIYQNNVNVGTATAEVMGMGEYYGMQKKTFAIKGKVSSVQVIGSPCAYTGKKVEPSVVVRGNDGKTLTKGVDYTVAYSNNVYAGSSATATAYGKGNYTGSAVGKFVITKRSVMRRLYNPNSGEHFYTASDSEYKNVKAAGWKDEGVGWTAPSASNTPVYRLYNRHGGEHHYTTSTKEKNDLVKAGWRYEGIGWFSDDAKKVPLYREYNPNAFANNHNYTASKKEHDWLISLGWRNEGYAWYGM